MSWLRLVTSSCCLVLSTRKPRISGCVYCAEYSVLKKGLSVDVVLLVVLRELLAETRRLPPPQRKFCRYPPLNVAAVCVMPFCPTGTRCSVLVGGFSTELLPMRDVSVGL